VRRTLARLPTGSVSITRHFNPVPNTEQQVSVAMETEEAAVGVTPAPATQSDEDDSRLIIDEGEPSTSAGHAVVPPLILKKTANNIWSRAILDMSNVSLRHRHPLPPLTLPFVSARMIPHSRARGEKRASAR